MNISALNVGPARVFKKAPSFGQTHQKPTDKRAEQDVFVRTGTANTTGAAGATEVADVTKTTICTLKDRHPVTDEEMETIKALEPRLAETTNKLFEAKRECEQRMYKRQALCDQKRDAAVKLYGSRAKIAPEGGKVVVQNNKMFEYGRNGKQAVRKTTFEDGFTYVWKRFPIIGERYVKTKVKVPTVTEFNADGTKSIFSEEGYVIGYKKHSDGSEEYKAKLDTSKGKGERIYSEGYRKDKEGNETFETSLYEDSHETKVYVENEQRFNDGSVSIENIYKPDAAPMRLGPPPETVYTGYKKDADGNESYAEQSVCSLGKYLHLYVKDFTKTPEGKEDWSEFFEQENSCKWHSCTPSYW